jgi:hypothetical protein
MRTSPVTSAQNVYVALERPGKAGIEPIIGDDGRTELRKRRPCAQFLATLVDSIGGEASGNEGELHARSKGSRLPRTAGWSGSHG